jgi:hypothetical protein
MSDGRSEYAGMEPGAFSGCFRLPGSHAIQRNSWVFSIYRFFRRSAATFSNHRAGETVMRHFIVVVTICLLSWQDAEAELIIDQQNPDNGGPVNGWTIPLFQPMGQTFAPSLNSLNVVILNLQDPNHRGGPWGVEVHQGLDGALLGTSQAVSLPADFGSGHIAGLPIEFDFATPVTLTPGLTYSLEPIRFGAGAFNLISTEADGYDGGSLFLKDSIQPGDAIFSEGLNISSVPEPSTLIMFGSAAILAIAVGCQRRLRRIAVACGRFE